VRENGTAWLIGHKGTGDDLLTLEAQPPVNKLVTTSACSIDGGLQVLFRHNQRSTGAWEVSVCVLSDGSRTAFV
jgi:hypothetical protein